MSRHILPQPRMQVPITLAKRPPIASVSVEPQARLRSLPPPSSQTYQQQNLEPRPPSPYLATRNLVTVAQSAPSGRVRRWPLTGS
jgi:hypothetical protein